jgi:hypothetical protein
LPTASYLHTRPSTSSSLTSSDASCPPPFAQDPVGHSGDLTAAIPPRPTSIGRYSPVNTPSRRARPLSMSSTHTYGSTARASRIYGVPHAPHNQIQIILPTPLASANNSRESLAMTRARFGPDAFDRRSIADPWMSMPAHLSESFPSYSDYRRPIWNRHGAPVCRVPFPNTNPRSRVKAAAASRICRYAHLEGPPYGI